MEDYRDMKLQHDKLKKYLYFKFVQYLTNIANIATSVKFIATL